MRSLVLVYGDSLGARLDFAKRRFPQADKLGHDPPLTDVSYQLTATTPGPAALILRGDAPALFVRLCDLVIHATSDGGYVVEKGVLE